MHSARLFHYCFELSLCCLSVIFNGTVIYVGLFKKHGINKSYSKMFLINGCFDLFFSLFAIFTMNIFDLSGGVMTFVMDNPLWYDWEPIKYISSLGWTTCYYVAMFIIPVQYWYRYSTVTKFKAIKFKYVLVFAVFLITIHILAVYFSMNAPNEVFDKNLLSNKLYEGIIPKQYISMETASTFAQVNQMEIFAITFIAYTFAICVGIKTWRFLQTSMDRVSESTKKLQSRVTKIMILQTCYPLFVFIIPSCIIILYPLYCPGCDASALGLLCVCAQTLLPVLNPLSVVILIPAYRKVILKWIGFSDKVADLSSAADETTKVHSVSVSEHLH